MSFSRKIISLALSAAVAMSSAVFLAPSSSALETLPEKYDSRDYGCITPVRNQQSYGTCWAHGTLAACEASLIKNNGYPCDLDLAEFHLAYSSFHTMYDRLGLFDSKVDDNFLQTYMNDGGDCERAAIALSCWNGPVLDSSHYRQFTSDKFVQHGLNQLDFASKELQYCMNAAQLTDYYIVDTSDIPRMKEYIMKYGAGTISLSSHNDYRDDEKGIWFYNEESSRQSMGHLMAVVGWDDTIPASQLSVNGYTPSQDGAFIVKNSWGEDYGNNGYYYVPYEPYMLQGDSMFFSFADADTYTYNYGYDDSIPNQPFFDENDEDTVSTANVFTATADDETLEAVSFFPSADCVSYEVKVYTDLPADYTAPEKGTLSAEMSGIADRGYRTLRLPQAIDLHAGERFSVVVTLSSNDGSRVTYDVNLNYSKDFHRERGESFLYTSAKGWYDICDSDPSLEGNARIKAFTVSPSAAALTEPEDYNSYNGQTREELIRQMHDVQARCQVMTTDGYLNYNSDDLSLLDRYEWIFDSIEEHTEMYTASEIYATVSNYTVLLDHVRMIEPCSLLPDMDMIAMQVMNWKGIENVQYWQEYKDNYDKVLRMAQNRELNRDNIMEIRKELGDSFIKLLIELIENGYGVSKLQYYGDVDHDGRITVLDATEIQRILASIKKKSVYAAYCIDVDGDHVDSILDATYIQRYLAQMIQFFPVYYDTHYVEDDYSISSSKEEVKAYLTAAIEERSTWDRIDIDVFTDYDTIFAYVIYQHAKRMLADADNLETAVLLYYTRNLISQVSVNPF